MAIIIPAPASSIRLTTAAAKNLRIVFLGTPTFVTQVLRALQKSGWPIAAVVTAADRPVGRKKILTPSPVKVTAQELGIPIVSIDQLAELKPDLCIIAAYNKIIPQRILDIPRLGFLNIHPSLLPAYRGPSPVRSAILDGITDSGVSIMLLDREMDHGPILAQQPWHIPTGLDAPAAEEEGFRLGSELLLRTLPEYVAGKIIPHIQDHPKATYSKKFTREDGRLDFSRPPQEIHNRIRALGDAPGAWTLVNGKILNILDSHVSDGKLIPDAVQMEGGKPMDWESFLRGHPGTTLS